MISLYLQQTAAARSAAMALSSSQTTGGRLITRCSSLLLFVTPTFRAFLFNMIYDYSIAHKPLLWVEAGAHVACKRPQSAAQEHLKHLQNNVHYLILFF
jgi:hypothetical protein